MIPIPKNLYHREKLVLKLINYNLSLTTATLRK